MNQIKILVVDDEQSMLDFLNVMLSDDGYEVCVSSDPETAYRQAESFQPHLSLVDVRMTPKNGLWLLEQLKKRNQDTVVVMMTAYIDVDEVVEAMKNGAYDYITKPFNVAELRAVLKNALEHKKRAAEKPSQRVSEFRAGLGNFIGDSRAMQTVFNEIEKTASLDSTILITGESGTGKELTARAIHYQSPRRNSPFISIDASSIPETLLESELFGHMKGSFTGAEKNKIGLFEAAEDGTVFLDEIAELPIGLQSKLLRVLQEREIRRIGNTQPISIRARMIAATNRVLVDEVKNGRFREDLYFRLNIINIHLPRLAERKEDIPVLVQFFLDKLSKRLGKEKPKISSDAVKMLMDYEWPGNVRELENALERAMILEESGLLGIMSFSKRISHPESEARIIPASGSLKESVEEFERQIIKQALDEMNGNQYKAARKLKMTRQSLQYKLKKYRLIK